MLTVGSYPARNTSMVVVETYLDLINRHQFVFTEELKRLWLLRSGVLDGRIENTSAVLDSLERAGFMEEDLSPFFNLCVQTNLKAIADNLLDSIERRTRYRGYEPDNDNPEINLRNDLSNARRLKYYPTIGVLQDLLRIFTGVINAPEDAGLTNGSRLTAAAIAVELDLDVVNNNSGVSNKRPECPDLVRSVAAGAAELIHAAIATNRPYMAVSYPVVRILWVINRLLIGDISTYAYVPNTTAIDILRTIRVSDSTLAASPSPSVQALETFVSSKEPQLSHKGYRYLSAIRSMLTTGAA